MLFSCKIFNNYCHLLQRDTKFLLKLHYMSQNISTLDLFTRDATLANSAAFEITNSVRRLLSQRTFIHPEWKKNIFILKNFFCLSANLRAKYLTSITEGQLTAEMRTIFNTKLYRWKISMNLRYIHRGVSRSAILQDVTEVNREVKLFWN